MPSYLPVVQNIYMYMYCMYRHIENLKYRYFIVIQYWLFGVSIHWSGQFSKLGFSHLSDCIPTCTL